MKFVEKFCRDNYPKDQEYLTFEIQTVIPKSKKKLVAKWAKMYQLFGVSFKEVEKGWEFEAHGDCIDGQEELFDELLEELYSVVGGQEKIKYYFEDPKRPAYSWDGVVYPKGGQFVYSKGGVEYLL